MRKTSHPPKQKERPILFSGPMVRAILEGRKTQTRRVIKPQPSRTAKHDAQISCDGKVFAFGFIDEAGLHDFTCPYGQPGDRLWVRETFAGSDSRSLCYRADTNSPKPPNDGDRLGCERWTPSIYMPRWASRITLEITKIGVERLQEISEEDAIAEGVEGRWHPDADKLWTWKDYLRTKRFHEEMYSYGSAVTARTSFQTLWDSINGVGAWDKNPWVWVIEFKTLGEPGATNTR